ncbi:HAD-IA family hydrolase [Exilibacterium tricleocarpae]|uniref:HAD-IA family hydrolase n=1 Tax=Exilibacterium tricleocarpae TaxID=2591008 RepID=A0A545T8C9_9GAMM|nr:HAD-IA family hydrolase [Exilibacterium tricleocarpae]TQV73480.1 HAD-IA family hydrolase [Exilibacterium tricleocarpae]
MLFIFDWDGTISDSTGRIIDCVQRAAADSGLEPLADDAIKDIIGLGLKEALERLYPGAGEERRQLLTSSYARHFVAADQTPSPFYPGVRATLEQLLRDGHQLAVATGKSRRGLDRILANTQLQDFFHGSRCADETASKPHPQMLCELLDEFDVDPAAAVMVGDTEYDMEMARQLDMPRIAVSYGAHHIDRLRGYDPVLCVDYFEEILAWVDN